MCVLKANDIKFSRSDILKQIQPLCSNQQTDNLDSSVKKLSISQPLSYIQIVIMKYVFMDIIILKSTDL